MQLSALRVDYSILPTMTDPYLYYIFSKVKDVETTEDDRPSLAIQKKKKKDSKKNAPNQNVPVQVHVMPNVMQEEDADAESGEATSTSSVATPQFAPSTMTSTQNARFLVNCVECRKPRVMYSLHKLTERQKVSLVTSMSEYDYTCGAPVLPPSNTLHNKVMVRAFLTCSMPVEIPYYGSELGRTDTCAHCAAEEAETDQELKKKHKTVLPICIACREAGKTPVLQRPYGKQ